MDQWGGVSFLSQLVNKILMSSVRLSDSENNTITIVKILVFTIVNTITIVGDQFFTTMITNKKA